MKLYRIKCAIPQNREPWAVSLEQRIRMVRSAAEQGRKVALLLYRQADTSTFRYRCYNIYQATRDSEWQSVYFFLNELDAVESLLCMSQVLVLTRIKWSYLLDSLVHKARKKGIPVLFDVDDLICDIRYLPLLTNTLNVHFGSEIDYDFWFAYISRHQAVAERVDGFTTTNPFLGEKLSERYNKPYQVIMNSLNEEQLLVSKRCRQRKERQKSGGPFTIGYFSGTPSHINDFRVAYRELLQLLEDYPKMALQVVGFMEFPQEMETMIQKGRITFIPLVDFMELQRLIAQVDVNIVPLVHNAFTNCKSELKFFEAAAVDSITVATPTYTYEKAIRHGETGFLCEQGSWYDTIARIYEHPTEAMQIAKCAREYCLATYAGNSFKEQVCATYDYFAR